MKDVRMKYIYFAKKWCWWFWYFKDTGGQMSDSIFNMFMKGGIQQLRGQNFAIF